MCLTYMKVISWRQKYTSSDGDTDKKIITLPCKYWTKYGIYGMEYGCETLTIYQYYEDMSISYIDNFVQQKK